MLNASAITMLHDHATRAWHQPSSSGLERPSDAFLALVLAQHRTNYDLWHEEDKARDTQAEDAAIVRAKHAIDSLNQQRNDLVERLDQLLLEQAPAQPQNAPLHSETPGLIVDRLSILALKLYHTQEEADRENASAEHRDRNRTRLQILVHQRQDLATCLDALWAEILGGTRRFQLYRQMKMYNDPELNPVLYGSRR